MKVNAIVCKCYSLDHMVILESIEDEIYLTVHLTPKPFFKRLWKAVKYVFGFRSKYGDFDEFILDKEEFVDKFVKLYSGRI